MKHGFQFAKEMRLFYNCFFFFIYIKERDSEKWLLKAGKQNLYRKNGGNCIESHSRKSLAKGFCVWRTMFGLASAQ